MNANCHNQSNTVPCIFMQMEKPIIYKRMAMRMQRTQCYRSHCYILIACFFVFFLLIPSTMARTRAHTNTRIINGVDSEPLPSFAYIIIVRKNGQNISQCGGTLVHPDVGTCNKTHHSSGFSQNSSTQHERAVVLTAAHCVEDDLIDAIQSINVFVMNKETENPLFQFVQNPSGFSDSTSGTHSIVSMRHPHPQYDSSTNEVNPFNTNVAIYLRRICEKI